MGRNSPEEEAPNLLKATRNKKAILFFLKV